MSNPKWVIQFLGEKGEDGGYIERKGFYHQPPLLSIGPSSCCSVGHGLGTAGPGSWAHP